jgi:hypothetical protein
MKKQAFFLLLAAAAVLLAPGCSNPLNQERPTQTGETMQLQAALSISDAVHGADGNPHFFFLPPLAPYPEEFNGDFDGALAPKVEIWTLNTAGEDPLPLELFHNFTPDPGQGSERVRVVPEEEHYIVNWHTNRFDLSEDACYRIRVLVEGYELGYADVYVTGSGSAKKEVDTEKYVVLKYGRTLPIKFRIEEGACIPVTGVQLPESLTLETGASDSLTAVLTPAAATYSAAGWSCSDEDIVAIAQDPDNPLLCALYGEAEGEAVVTVEVDGIPASCSVTVETPWVAVTGVELQQTGSAELTAVIYPQDASNTGVSWQSSDPEVAAVGAPGLVCSVAASGPGFATVTVTTGDGGYQATATVAVGAAPAAWGRNDYRQSDAPAGNDFVALDGGWYHSLALRTDGSLVAWGSDMYGQCSSIPGGTTPLGYNQWQSVAADFSAPAAGANHNLALKNDGTLAAWGYNGSGQCSSIPGGTIPLGYNLWLSVAADFSAPAAGYSSSAALLSGNSLWVWGAPGLPAPPPYPVRAAALGGYSILALADDGSLAVWGNIPPAPAGNDFVAIAGGYLHALALKSDGSIVAWGSNGYGQCSSIPGGSKPIGPSQWRSVSTDFTAVAAGGYHSLALKSDGSLVAWGDDYFGQCSEIPGGAVSLDSSQWQSEAADFSAVAAGQFHSQALQGALSMLITFP